MNISKATDQCVMCGMCLPHCPTYQISQHEAESPRGRISLIKAYSEKSLPPSEALQSHLYSCTTCLKCEQVCPANVHYENIIDYGRRLYRTELGLFKRIQQFVAISMLSTKLGHKVITFAKTISRILPSNIKAVQVLKLANMRASHSIQESHKNSMTVLPGCTGNIFDLQTLESVTKVLAALDYDTVFPDGILCCGALAQHSGLSNIADSQIQATNDFFRTNNVKEYISFASGCGRQYNNEFSKSDIKHYDIVNWLVKHQHIHQLKINPLSAHVLIHTPCTVDQYNIGLCEQLLDFIPDIYVSQFNDGLSCCGAGGAQLLFPQDSNQKLLDAKINTIESMQPDIIVSSNIGCAMQLKLGLAKADLDIEVIHPVTLLSRQLNQ